MAIEIIGALKKFLPVVSGTSSKGDWTKQSFILETDGPYPKEIEISDMNDKANAIGFAVGSMVKCSVDIVSRFYNEKYYTNITAYKIEAHGDSTPPKQPVTKPTAQYVPPATQPRGEASVPQRFANNPVDSDDSELPF